QPSPSVSTGRLPGAQRIAVGQSGGGGGGGAAPPSASPSLPAAIADSVDPSSGAVEAAQPVTRQRAKRDPKVRIEAIWQISLKKRRIVCRSTFMEVFAPAFADLTQGGRFFSPSFQDGLPPLRVRGSR